MRKGEISGIFTNFHEFFLNLQKKAGNGRNADKKMSGAEAKKLPQDGGQVTQRPGHAGAAGFSGTAAETDPLSQLQKAAGFSGRTPALPAEHLPLADVLLFA